MALIKLNNRSSEDNAIHGRRNLIINGAMQVAQRGTSVTGLEVGQGRTCDRIGTYVNSGTWTVTQETDSPDGFSNSFKILATAVESAAAGDQIQIFYTIEGQDLQGVAKGTSSAKQMTLSWWCKSNKTGTHAVALRDQDNNRLCTKYFTINSVDTWEYKTLNIPTDTTGAFDNDNAGSLQIEMWMRAGTNYTSGTPTGAWETFDNSIRLGDGHTATVGTAVNDYFQITGYQLEVGNTATPFEHRSYGEELALCQRYYEVGDFYGYFTTTSSGSYNPDAIYQGEFKTQKRTAPSMTQTNYTNVGSAASATPANITVHGFTQAIEIVGGGGAGGHDYDWQADAEL